MSNSILAYSCFILFGVFISSISQVMLKKATLKSYDTPIKEYLNPLVIIAYILFGGTTLMSVIAYKVVPLSLGAALEATSYIYITFFGVIIFKEKLTIQKLFSLALIITGILVYSFL